MDTIKEYLNNLFLAFPETPEVVRAKEELLEMMEDKFEECLKEGKTEKEAVGIVVSEFGNIEEIAEELGISQYLKKGEAFERKAEGEESFSETEHSSWGSSESTGQNFGVFWNQEMAEEFIKYAWRHAWMVAAGIGCILLEGTVHGKLSGVPMLVIGIVVLVLARRMSQEHLPGKNPMGIRLGAELAEYIREQRKKDEDKIFYMRLAAVLLCFFVGSFHIGDLKFIGKISDLCMTLGIILFIAAGSVSARYKEIAKMEAFYDYQPKKRGWGMIILICLAVWACISLAGVVGYMKEGSSGAKEIHSTYDARKIKVLNIDLTTEDLDIQCGDGEQIEVDYQGKNKLKETVDGETLELKSKQKLWHFFWSFGNDTHSSVVKITLPRSMNYATSGDSVETLVEEGHAFKAVTIRMDTGNLTMNRLCSKDMDLDVDTGDIELSEILGKNVKLDLDTGDASLTETKFQTLDAELDTGDFMIKLSKEMYQLIPVRLSTDIGKVLVYGVDQGRKLEKTEGEWKDYHLTAESDTGDIQIGE